jgi:hypothetical protein
VDPLEYVDAAGEIATALNDLGLTPVLVGGAALVILGSRRVTRDFDFVIGSPYGRLSDAIAVFYDRGFELTSRLDEHGDVAATIDNPRVAAIRLRHDSPSSAYFFNRSTRLRIDLLFDFPIPAADLMKRATRMKIRSEVLHVASDHDLLRLKQIARADRSVAADAQDIEFLEARLKKAAKQRKGR